MSFISIRKKPVLGGTCSRLAYTKQQVASSHINIYDRKSTFFGPDGSSPAQPGPSPARTRFWKSGNLEIQKFEIQTYIKNQNSQNPNPCRPRCRQGLDYPEKDLPGSICGHPRYFFHRPTKIKTCQHFVYSPWWANGAYSPGLGCWKVSKIE